MQPGLYQQLFNCARLDFTVSVQNLAHCAFFGSAFYMYADPIHPKLTATVCTQDFLCC